MRPEEKCRGSGKLPRLLEPPLASFTQVEGWPSKASHSGPDPTSEATSYEVGVVHSFSVISPFQWLTSSTDLQIHKASNST